MMVMARIVDWLKSDWWMVGGRISYKRGEYRAGLDFFQRVVAIYPEHLRAQSYIGACYMALLQYDDAISAFERGLQIRSDSAYCHAELGRAFMYLSRDREAVESLRRAFRIEAKYETKGAYVLALAAAYAGLAEFEIARRFYTDAVRLLPESADAHHGLGWALRSMERSQEAEAPLRRAIALESNDPASHNELGNVLFDLGRSSEAEQEYRLAIKLEPNNPVWHHSLGWTLARQDRYAEAIAEYEEVVKLNPANAEAYFDLGVAQAMLENFEGAIMAYESALRLYSAPPDGLLLCLGVAYIHCKRWDEGRRICERLVCQNPEEQEGHFYLAFAYAELNRDREAIEAYKEVLRLDPGFFAAVANLGLSCLKLEILPEAVAAFQRAMKLNPNEPGVHVKLGEAYVKLGELSEARRELSILQEVDPDLAKELGDLIAAASEVHSEPDA
jgi:tetratricopeptide (TPR) repeat protein